MAMVKITNGEITQIVSRGAYETQYKNFGFWIDGEQVRKVSKPVKENIKPENKVNAVEEVEERAEEVEDDDFEELLEKPLSQWSNEELKLFTNAKGIDTSSAKKTSEVRGIVKRYLDNEAKKAAETF